MTVRVPQRNIPSQTGAAGQVQLHASQAFTSLPSLLRAALHRWRLLGATAIGGLMTALLFSLVFPPPYSATTVLLLRHPAQSDPTRAMLTDAELLKTRTVAQRAIDRLGLSLSARELSSSYDVLPLSDDVLRLTVTAPTARDAVRRSQAVAEEFLSFRREEFERQSRAVAERLEERQTELQGELSTVVDRINRYSATPGPPNDVAVRELGDLLTRRAVISDHISQLGQRIESAVSDPTSVVEKSRILDPASEDDRSPLRAFAANLAAGLVGGLAVGAGWVILQEVTSERVRRLDEVVGDLGAPTAVGVGGLRGSLRAQRRRFRRQPGLRRDIAGAVRHLRGALSSGDIKPALVLASVDSDGPGALLVASLGRELAKDGKDVLVADFSRASAVAQLLDVSAGKTSRIHIDGATSRFHLTVPRIGPENPSAKSESEQSPAELRQEADVVLTLATLDPALGAGHLAEWATTAVALVTVNRSTRAAFRTASQMLRAAGFALHSVVVVGAERNDSRGVSARAVLP